MHVEDEWQRAKGMNAGAKGGEDGSGSGCRDASDGSSKHEGVS